MPTFSVYSRRRNHNDDYRITRTPTGWNVQYIRIGGDCDKRGQPFLFDNLEHDFINYPAGLGGYLEWLWAQANENDMSDQELQTHLDMLAEWVSETERATPAGIFEQYG